MAEPANEEALLGPNNVENAWRLDVSRFRPPESTSPQSPTDARFQCLNRFGKARKLNRYYKQQGEILEAFLEMDSMGEEGYIPTSTQADRDHIKQGERLAIRISNIANIIIFAAKVFACMKSLSLAIIASTLDSLLDLLSGFILWYAAFSMRKKNPYLYPIGKKRMQPLGILVFAAVMATLGLQIIVESIRELLSSSHFLDLNGQKKYWVVGIMVGTTVVKFGLMLYCRSFSNEIVRTYAQDHFFDVITNVIGLAAALLANAFYWWIDPTGAIVLALYTMRTWSLTVLENVHALVSRTASPDFLAKITYLVWNHHKSILKIDTVRAYTFGTHYFAEVDIVLPSEMPLKEAHDIGESLQNKVESLPEVERAFVHLDYEDQHKPEHAGHDDY